MEEEDKEEAAAGLEEEDVDLLRVGLRGGTPASAMTNRFASPPSCLPSLPSFLLLELFEFESADSLEAEWRWTEEGELKREEEGDITVPKVRGGRGGEDMGRDWVEGDLGGGGGGRRKWKIITKTEKQFFFLNEDGMTKVVLRSRRSPCTGKDA